MWFDIQCLHLWKLATWRFECRGFTVFLLLIQKRWELQGLPFWLLLEVWMPKSNLSCLSLYPRQPSPVCVCVCVCVCMHARACRNTLALSHVRLFATPMDCSPARLLSPWDFPGYWSGLPLPPPAPVSTWDEFPWGAVYLEGLSIDMQVSS